jgi:hypothetical protein
MEQTEKKNRNKIVLEFDDEIITAKEYLDNLADDDTDTELRMTRAQINTMAKMMGKHARPKMSFMEVMQLPYIDFLENIKRFTQRQGVEYKNDFLGK